MASDYAFATPMVRSDSPHADVDFTCSTDPPPGLEWGDAEPIEVPDTGSDDEEAFVFARFSSHTGVRIVTAADFHTFDDRIVGHLLDERHRYLVEIALFGMVFALWHERRGTVTLHGSAAAVGGRAVAFLGDKGAGKTSVAAAHVAAGHAFLTDDLLVVEQGEGSARAHRAIPAIRLWPEGVRHFVGADPEDFPAPHPDLDKRRVPLEASGLGVFAPGPARLDRIYLLQREATGSEVTITALRGQEAVMALVRYSYLPAEVAGYGWQGSRLARLARLAGDVEVRLLRYGSDLDRLQGVVAAVERDLG
jgi:hypothetical protein